MKRITLVAALLAVPGIGYTAPPMSDPYPPVVVDSGFSVNANANSDSRSNSQAGAVSGSTNNINISSHTPDRQHIDYSGSYNVKTNSMVALAAGVSMSSDYCGGTASGGASAAGITIGAAKPIIDITCQSLRLIEKTGIGAVTAHNLGDKETAHKLLRLMVWQTCVLETERDRGAANRIPSLQQACLDLGLIQERSMAKSNDPTPVK